MFLFGWAKDRPMIFWDTREKETVVENDVLNNYDLLTEYILAVGGKTPLPDLLHHEVLHVFSLYVCVEANVKNTYTLYKWLITPGSVQAAFILVSVTYNLHQQVYGARGGRGLIRDPCYFINSPMEFQNCHMLFVNESRRPYFLLHLMLANNDGAVE